ncbi:hypothetical protein [Nocardioides sp. AE5]|uniref:hypothetical protein n=1 Tax=Nocardioides sp. AE5 TaxID=2962573 RepID=UPI0028827958|nr:hypothetical protein [Nocardioides sp. AE5]MDT0200428.1 hypothetical protein [Nocardioides sp. AE5]
MKRALVATALASTLVLTGGCLTKNDDGPAPTGAGETGGTDAEPTFTERAASLCTETINANYLTPGLYPGIEALQAIVQDQRPEPEQVQKWVTELTILIEHHEAVKAGLANLADGSAAEQEAWAVVVSSGDADLTLMEQRKQLLESDWDDAAGNYPTRDSVEESVTADEFVDALVALQLHGTDCVAPYSSALWQVPEENAPFVRAATEACTAVLLRRLANGYQADTSASLDVFVAVREDDWDGTVPDGTEEALERLIAEWEQTATDLAGVETSAALDPDQWQATVTAAQSRVDVHRTRLDALRGGDAETMRTAWLPSSGQPGDLAVNGLRERSCAGIAF